MNVLDRIVDDTRDEVARRRERVPLAQLERALDDRPQARPFQEALARPGVSLIAEHKRRSPSAGVIREGATVTEIVQAYESGGAGALSGYTGTAANFGTYTIALTGAFGASVPEPGSLVLFSSGLLGLLTAGALRRRGRAGLDPGGDRPSEM